MSNITVESKKLQGPFSPPPDKSISHRAVIIGSLAEGQTRVKNLSVCQDCLRTVEAFRSLGIRINKGSDLFSIQGKGLEGLSRPKKNLYLGNSGTSMRLILGVLAGQEFSCTLTGDASLSKRPMRRVTRPLSLMGAKIKGGNSCEYAPLTIQGGALSPICYEMPVASAQVKSAILLAGLYAQGKTELRQAAQSRDHTERMLKKFGAEISLKAQTVSVTGRARLSKKDVQVPGDISAASFFLVGACISKGSQVLAKSVGLNPTRTAFLQVLQKMGANISYKQKSGKDYSDEPEGEIVAAYSPLKAITISPEQVPFLIDELPILMVAATQAEGQTKISQAGELRFKETDRIKAMVSDLSRMGADIESYDNDVIIRGPARLSAGTVNSFGDHRTAMSMAIAALVAGGRTTIKDIDCVNISFPGFFQTLSQLFA